MTSHPSNPSRFAGLDGLRAIAVLLVLIYHLFPQSPLRSGFVGVDVFFVISGFLITSLLLRPTASRNGRIRLRDFWRRRARRLLPALAVVVTVCASAAWLIGGDVLVGIGRQVLGAATFSYNWLAVADGSDYFGATAPELFRNMWSLAVEEQFYLLWPLLLPLVLMLPRRWMRVGITLIAASASAIWMASFAGSDQITRAYFGTDTHAFGLLLGIALAFVVHGGRGRIPERVLSAAAAPAGLIGIAAIVTAAVLPESEDIRTFPGALLLASVGTALVIVAGIRSGSRLGRALDVAPLKWIGDRSYGIYLWHWPVLVLVLAATTGTGPEAGIPIGIGVLVLAVTVLAAGVSYRFVETPLRRFGFRRSLRALGQRFAGTPTRRLTGIAAVLVAATAIGGTSAAVANAPDETSAARLIEAGADAVTAAADSIPQPEPTARAISGEEITAIGDSVMLASAPSLYDTLPGIEVDAEVSRPMRAGAEIIRALADAGRLRPYVVVALGTNGAIDADQLQELLGAIGPSRQLILVNAYAPRDWIPGVNETIKDFADDRRRVTLADWSGAIAGHTDLLAGDDIHPGRAGGDIFAASVVDALDRIEQERIRMEKQRAHAPDGRAPRVPYAG